VKSKLIKRNPLVIAVTALGLIGSVLGLLAAPANAARSSGDGRGPTHAQPRDIAASSGTFPVENLMTMKGNTAWCLGITGGHDYAPAVLWKCNASANQTWHWGHQGGAVNFYQLVNGDNQCLGVQAASKKQGARIYAWRCLGASHPDQYWTIDSMNCYTPFCPLVDLHSGYYLSVAGGTHVASNGAHIVQWHLQTGPNNQQWNTDKLP
jgi:hypothetical protein